MTDFEIAQIQRAQAVQYHVQILASHIIAPEGSDRDTMLQVYSQSMPNLAGNGNVLSK